MAKLKKNKIMGIYFKVYQNKESLEHSYFVCPIEDAAVIAQGAIDEFNDNNSLPVIFEPVEMTKEEYENLPEFEGY